MKYKILGESTYKGGCPDPKVPTIYFFHLMEENGTLSFRIAAALASDGLSRKELIQRSTIINTIIGVGALGNVEEIYRKTEYPDDDPRTYVNRDCIEEIIFGD